MKYSDIKFVAYEGGGGKGVVYIGATFALEAAQKLPMTPKQREKVAALKEENKGKEGAGDILKNDVLYGVSGASAGAINAFFTALGQSAEETMEMSQVWEAESILIEKEVSGLPYKTGQILPKDNKGVQQYITQIGEDNVLKIPKGETIFYTFYDEPIAGLYKGVMYDKGINLPCWSTSEITNKGFEFISDEVYYQPTKNKDTPLEPKADVSAPKDFPDFEQALSYAKNKNRSFYEKYFLPYPALFGLFTLKKKKWRKSKHPVIKKVMSYKYKGVKDYYYSLLYDKGLFTGINIARVLTAKMRELLRQNWEVDLTLEDCRKLTFFDFVNITGNDLRIAGANIARGVPVMWSAFLTPDFPVVDAVCMSMAIPGAFKPVYLGNTWVRKNIIHRAHYNYGEPNGLVRGETDPANSSHNQYYRGYYNDGGTLTNLPIHAFDYWDDESEYLETIKVLNKNMFGIRCSGGTPFDENEDPKYATEDLLYLEYLKLPPEKHLEGTEKIKKKPETKQFIEPNADRTAIKINEGWNNRFSSILSFGTKVLGALMYDMEEGQIRSKEELIQTMNLFAYDIDIFDFTAPKELSCFTQARALIKVGIRMQVDAKDIINKAADQYYCEIFPDADINYLRRRVEIYYDHLKNRLDGRKPDIYFRNIS